MRVERPGRHRPGRHRAGQRRPDDPGRPRRCRARRRRRPKRSGCWRWSPAKTSNPATRRDVADRPGDPPGPDGVGRTIPSPATCTRPRSNYRDGFKAHIGVEPDTGLITACELTAGNVGDAQAAPGLLAGETVTGRGARRLRLRLRRVPRPSRRARPHRDDQTDPAAHRRSPTGSPSTTSRSTSTAMTATCPNGITVDDQPPIAPGPLRRDAATAARCVNAAPAAASGKILTVHDHHELLAAARAHALTADVHRALPPAPPDGRTLHRLARPPRRPQSPLPRHRPQPHRARPPLRRDQPATPPQPRPHTGTTAGSSPH